MAKISHLIINSPYEKPVRHWDTKTFEEKDGRRPAGYLFVSKEYEDSTEFYELKLVNKIRERLDDWRENNYPGITSVTKRLLEHWKNPKMRKHQFFFCQLEAIETLIWLAEGPDDTKEGIDIPSDGGPFKRICSKMATGTGKTIVMGMFIAWQVLNKIAYPTDLRFSKNFLVVAPGLTVKDRLSVLEPGGEKLSIYDEFGIVPTQDFEKLYQVNIKIHNWHVLMPLNESKKSVVRLGLESNEVFTKRILGDESTWKNLRVINDEAHHAWRPKSENYTNEKKLNEDEEEAKIWLQGLEKIHDVRNIYSCYDFSATPLIPSGKDKSEQIFDWIISDFSLTDAIESGLVKTPKMTVREDGNDGREFYHIYSNDDVKIDIRQPREPNEPLPSLVKNAYILLGQHWKNVRSNWQKANKDVPPVMISVCNRTETAARVEYSFKNNKFGLDALGDEEKILRIDSKVLKKVESGESADAKELLLRKMVGTIGKKGEPGGQIENIIAVQMLSEGWDARTVTHIMGLRAFTSQLLCEQVIGRGLRRTSYEVDKSTGMFSPEYVTVFGIPYAFLPHEQDSKENTTDEKPSTYIETVNTKKIHEISWPNIIRVNVTYTPSLKINWNEVREFGLNAQDVIGKNIMAPTLEGKTSNKVSVADLEKLGANFRMQTIIFQTTKEIFESIKNEWKGDKQFLLLQLVKIVEKFINLGKIRILNLLDDHEIRKKVTLMVQMDKIVRYIIDNIKHDSTESSLLEFDPNKEVMSTSDIRPWYTTKDCVLDVTKSHLNHGVYDNKWEKETINELESNPNVVSWVKNDRGLFQIEYNWYGKRRQYWPDFLIQLKNGKTLILEIKGVDEPEGKEKRERMREWVNAVNEDGRYGNWVSSVAFIPEQVNRIIMEKSDSSTTDKISAKCPKCNKLANLRTEVEELFGFRKIDGILRPQSWCRGCRKKNERIIIH